MSTVQKMSKFTWNVGVVVVDDERLVSFQFGEGENPLTVDLDPDYALRISNALRQASQEAQR